MPETKARPLNVRKSRPGVRQVMIGKDYHQLLFYLRADGHGTVRALVEQALVEKYGRPETREG